MLENYYANRAASNVGIKIDKNIVRSKNKKPRVLFYDILGMTFGGTAKHMQILSKYMDKSKYDVFFMYSDKVRYPDIDGDSAKSSATRYDYMKDSGVKLVLFQYDSASRIYPNIISNMNPSILDVIKDNNVDLLVVTSDGKSYFPYNLIRNIPIVLLNVFGSYSVQKNIVLNVTYTKGMINRVTSVVNDEIMRSMPIPLETPPNDSAMNGSLLRKRLKIPEDAIVFGRIGRDVDMIFDPIAIMAFKRVVARYSNVYYVVMSPPPISRKIVKEESIPNVHFLPSSSNESDIWAFHQANDIYAHFRKDGETFGLNIAEAMMCAKPIITHKSIVWNSHLEYLDKSFSRVADIDNIDQYEEYMKEFIDLKKTGQLIKMGELAQVKASKLFHVVNNIKQFEQWVDESLLVNKFK